MGGSRFLLIALFLGWICSGLGQVTDEISLPCVRRLLPCRPFIGTGATPTPMCCAPLGQMLKTEVECLCAVFDNMGLMQSLNITRDAALQLPKACGEDASLQLCKYAVNGTSSPGPSSKKSPTGEKDNTTSSSKSSGFEKVCSSNGKTLGFTILGALIILFS